MDRTHIYLPEDITREIANRARVQRMSKAQIIREALETGLKTKRTQKSGSAKALLDLAQMAGMLKGTGPRDLSINHDYYIWGGKKKTQE